MKFWTSFSYIKLYKPYKSWSGKGRGPLLNSSRDILQVNRKTLRITTEDSSEHITDFEHGNKRKKEKGDDGGSFDDDYELGEVFLRCIGFRAVWQAD